jgi:hypothetical protein
MKCPPTLFLTFSSRVCQRFLRITCPTGWHSSLKRLSKHVLMKTRTSYPNNRFGIDRSFRECEFPHPCTCCLLTQKTRFWLLLCHSTFPDVCNPPTVESHPFAETIAQLSIVHPVFPRIPPPTSAESITEHLIPHLVGGNCFSDRSTNAHHIDTWKS